MRNIKLFASPSWLPISVRASICRVCPNELLMMENVNLSMKLCFISNHYSPGVKINQLKLFSVDKQAVFLKSFIRKIPYSADSRAARCTLFTRVDFHILKEKHIFYWRQPSETPHFFPFPFGIGSSLDAVYRKNTANRFKTILLMIILFLRRLHTASRALPRSCSFRVVK